MLRARYVLLLMLPAAVCFALLAERAAAQAPPGPLKTDPAAPQQPAKPQEPEQEPIRVRVELVSTPVTVRDASGELVLDLTRDQFRVFDNGVEQRIEDFELGGDPISAVLVFETSSRVEPLLPAVRKAAILFTQAVLGQTGEAAILGFDDSVELLLDFHSDHDRIEEVISKLPVGTSGVRMQDALARAVSMLRRRPPDRRRVIVLVSEAVDQGSETPLGVVLREAQLNQITIYTVGLSTAAALLRAEPQPAAQSPFPPGTFPRPGLPGGVQTPTTEQQRAAQMDLLNAIALLVQMGTNAVAKNSHELLAAGTGGMYVRTFRDRAIEEAVSEIGGELHAQYTLTYRPTDVKPGGYHEIRVEVTRPNLTVRARPGYYLPAPEK
jgi:hypothetical protein